MPKNKGILNILFFKKKIQTTSIFDVFFLFLGKGGKNFKKGKNQGDADARRELIFKEDGQEYGQVQKMLGDGRAALSCYDGVARTGLIRGTMRRRVWINTVSFILINFT